MQKPESSDCFGGPFHAGKVKECDFGARFVSRAGWWTVAAPALMPGMPSADGK